MTLPLEILYEDERCLGVNKPVGLATQAPPGIDSLEGRLKSLLQDRSTEEREPYLSVPHRLDRCASGAMIFGKTRRAAQKLSQQFERRQVRKLYWACVAGEVLPVEGTWRDHLVKVFGHPRAEVVPADHPEARLAVLHYRTLGQTPFGSWLEIELETGRTHQVRVQAASRGWPVLGDAFYGATIPFGEQHADERLRGIALHARSLTFRVPGTHDSLTIVAPPPPAWESLGLPASP